MLDKTQFSNNESVGFNKMLTLLHLVVLEKLQNDRFR